MSISTRPSLLIFDLDGTLAHTVPQLALAVQQSAAELNLKVPTLDEVARYVGNGVTMLLARTIAGRFEVSLDEVDAALQRTAREHFNRHYSAGLPQNFTVYPGVREGLAHLRSLNLKCAVVTNKPEVFARPLLGFMGLAPYLDFILGGEVIPQRKPDPMPLFYVCSKLGVKPCRALMAGDSLNDIKAGQNAGMPTAAFTYGYNGGHDVREFKPDVVFNKFAELTAFIDSLPPC